MYACFTGIVVKNEFRSDGRDRRFISNVNINPIEHEYIPLIFTERKTFQ